MTLSTLYILLVDMKISTRFRYGTRLLIDLGIHCKNGPVFLKEIAKRQRISKKYLEQIIITLKTVGIIRTIRGSKGGYCLIKNPGELYLIEIYRALEGSTAIVDCLDNPESCPFDMIDKCSTKDTWNKLTMAIEGILKNITLEHLMRHSKRMTQKKR